MTGFEELTVFDGLVQPPVRLSPTVQARIYCRHDNIDRIQLDRGHRGTHQDSDNLKCVVARFAERLDELQRRERWLGCPG